MPTGIKNTVAQYERRTSDEFIGRPSRRGGAFEYAFHSAHLVAVAAACRLRIAAARQRTRYTNTLASAQKQSTVRDTERSDASQTFF